MPLHMYTTAVLLTSPTLYNTLPLHRRLRHRRRRRRRRPTSRSY
eukprot:COSAG01_NODE_50877_length_359_cov_1.342308_1_plen_43_part_01